MAVRQKKVLESGAKRVVVVTDKLVLAPAGWVVVFEDYEGFIPLVGWVWIQPAGGAGTPEWQPVVWDHSAQGLVPCITYGASFKGLRGPV